MCSPIAVEGKLISCLFPSEVVTRTLLWPSDSDGFRVDISWRVGFLMELVSVLQIKPTDAVEETEVHTEVEQLKSDAVVGKWTLVGMKVVLHLPKDSW